MRLRRTPEILFVEDASIEQGTKVLSLINRLSDERKPDIDPETDTDIADTNVIDPEPA